MKVAVASDHAGFDLKAELLAFVDSLGHQAHDAGVYSKAPCDYPDVAEAMGLALLNGQAERGILICGSGVGASIAANKMPGIRAGICHDAYSAHQGVEHDNINVLILGSRIVAGELARDLVRIFLDAQFTAEERHRRRLEKIALLERKYCRALTEAEAR